jgi:hypothetical protein
MELQGAREGQRREIPGQIVLPVLGVVPVVVPTWSLERIVALAKGPRIIKQIGDYGVGFTDTGYRGNSWDKHWLDHQMHLRLAIKLEESIKRTLQTISK